MPGFCSGIFLGNAVGLCILAKSYPHNKRMKKNCTRFLLVFTLLFFSSYGYSQSNEIKVRFIGNCGLHMTDGNLDIYVDFPYKSGAYGYMEYDKAELDSVKENSIFIFTHKHADHYSGIEMRKILKAKKGKKFTPWKTSRLEKFSKTIPDFDIQAFKTKHRFSLKHNSYLISWHGKKLFFSGDTEHPETIGKVRNIDFVFLPHWILTYAREKQIEIDAKTKVLYHIYPDQKIEEEIPNNMIVLRKQGQTISIPY